MTNEEFREYILFKLLDEDLTRFNYVAIDDDGEVYLYEYCPKITNSNWYARIKLSENIYNNFRRITPRLNLKELGINWKDTLVEL